MWGGGYGVRGGEGWRGCLQEPVEKLPPEVQPQGRVGDVEHQLLVWLEVELRGYQLQLCDLHPAEGRCQGWSRTEGKGLTQPQGLRPSSSNFCRLGSQMGGMEFSFAPQELNLDRVTQRSALWTQGLNGLPLFLCI